MSECYSKVVKPLYYSYLISSYFRAKKIMTLLAKQKLRKRDDIDSNANRIQVTVSTGPLPHKKKGKKV
jgi:hypothetical protein